MVSLSGEPYSALPTAFQYRTAYDKTCTCHSAPPAASVASGNPPRLHPVPGRRLRP